MTSLQETESVFKYLFQESRLATFKSWALDKRANVKCSSTNLAQAGFIKTDKTSTICVFCRKELVWDDPSDDPFKEHKDHSPSCAFLPFMKVPETEWETSESMAELLAILAIQPYMNNVMEFMDESEIAFKKASSKLAPYI